MKKLIDSRPRFTGEGDLKQWAIEVALPWLVENLELSAGVLCGSLSEELRRKVYGLGTQDELPATINWKSNGLVISPPGTGKAVALLVDALRHYRKIYVVIPSRTQAMEVERSLDFLYHKDLGGCITAELNNKGLIEIITTGVMHQKVLDKKSDLWRNDTLLVLDEGQRTMDEDRRTQFMAAVAAQQGMNVFIFSATIAPGNIPTVMGHGPEQEALVYELTKQMHPVNIEILVGGNSIDTDRMPELNSRDKTMLIFSPTRKGVIGNAKEFNKDDYPNLASVPVTGSHLVDEQIKMIKKAQETGKTTVVCGTPGTMDSGVTIDGLSVVDIEDRRVRVDFNEHGHREVYNESLPINHIMQMVRRVGRQKRTDGGKDKVRIWTRKYREDVLQDHPEYTPMTGGSEWSPVEDIVLDAAALDIPFKEIHDYMIVNYPMDRIEAALQNMLDHGMLIVNNDESDGDGYSLTEKGLQVVNLPFESYKWRRMIVEAPDVEIKTWLALACSFSSKRAYEMFDDEVEFDFGQDSMSDILTKVTLGVEYVSINFFHSSPEEADLYQRWNAESRNLSFSRMEAMEKIFNLACRALNIDFREFRLEQPKNERRHQLLEYIIKGGIKYGIFDLFLPAHSKKGMSEARITADKKLRRFFFDHQGFNVEGHEVADIVAIVAEQTWATSYHGSPIGYLGNVSLIPHDIVHEIVEEKARKQGWFKLEFREDDRGAFAKSSGVKHVPSRFGNDVQIGREYWCSVDRKLSPYITSVFAHYPADL